MDFTSWKTRTVIIFSAIVILALGYIGGLLTTKGFKLDGGLSYDGIASVVVGIVAIFAATVILPIMIQPLFRRQKSISDMTHENIKLIVGALNEVLDLLGELNISGDPVSDRDRKTLLALYSKIANYCTIIARHANDLPALSDFATKIEDPLTKSKSNFAEVVVPGSIIDDAIFLQIKEVLDPAIYELMEIRYQIN